MQKRILGVGLVITGVISIIFGFIRIFQPAEFGGDAYTYIYGAVNSGFSFVLFVIGLATIIVGASFLNAYEAPKPVNVEKKEEELPEI